MCRPLIILAGDFPYPFSTASVHLRNLAIGFVALVHGVHIATFGKTCTDTPHKVTTGITCTPTTRPLNTLAAGGVILLVYERSCPRLNPLISQSKPSGIPVVLDRVETNIFFIGFGASRLLYVS